MGSPHDRCPLHPQRRVVGICAHCLHERLTLLIESICPDDTTADADDAAGDAHCQQTIGHDEPNRQPPPRLPHLPSHERSASHSTGANKASSRERALHSHTKLEDSLNLALQKVKHAHQQLSYVSQSPYQGVIKLGPSASPLVPRGPSDRNPSMPASRRRSNASESDMKSLPGALNLPTKKKNSWFSISRGKASLLNSPLPDNSGKLEDPNGTQKSPGVKILAGRKSASDVIGRSCNSYKQAYMADLESIAEINLGEAAIRVEPNEANGDAQASSSWISSLFHRRKGSRHRSIDERHDMGTNNSAVDGKAESLLPDGAMTNQSPMSSTEAGRLSWDGPRPNFKQILKRIEARKKQQRVDCSPIHTLAVAAADGSKESFYEDGGMGHVSVLQKCKSTAPSRSGVSVDLPKSSRLPPLPQPSFSPMLHSNAKAPAARMDCGNGEAMDRESRTWGRAWNRTLSPLLGFKSQGRKGVRNSSHSHPDYAVQKQDMDLKSSAGAPPSSGSYIGSHLRGEGALDAQMQVSQ